MRSSGASDAVGGLKPVVSALAAADFVADCTVEGLLHAPELGAILAVGARILMISNEHPEILERLLPDPALKPRVDEGAALLAEASQMRVTSAAGTDLTVDVSQAPAAASWGCTNGPGTIARWPGGLCLCFPPAGTVNGAPWCSMRKGRFSRYQPVPKSASDMGFYKMGVPSRTYG